MIVDGLQLRREPENIEDKHAVALVNGSGTVVGHIPWNLAPVLSSFLLREFNKGMAEVTGERINRGGGYGLEVPCKYRLYGQKRYVDRLKEKLSSSLTTSSTSHSQQ